MSAKSLMIQGTASSAGKSLLVTALCRLFSRQGVRVAPFKSQNMSLNSFVTREGHEIGRAQAVQAEAAGIEPSALMNPILLKPASDRTSQIIVNGTVAASMDAKEYYRCRAAFRPAVKDAFRELSLRYDLILLEGAGSPAEINLRENDLANMGMADMADAPVVLVADIDRGGVFASLYGTVQLLEHDEQKRIKGFIVNKFRGERAILEPGLARLEELLGRPALGVLPYMDISIDEEDSLTERLTRRKKAVDTGEGLDIAVLRLPRMSNFTDYAPLDAQPDVALRYVSTTQSLGRPDLAILPGTKSTMADMAFLRQSGLADALLALHREGMPVLGICGGFQMLGSALRDPLGTESPTPEVPGMGLLPLVSTFAPVKKTVRTTLTISAGRGLFAGAQGMIVEGYEIHSGASAPLPSAVSMGITDAGTEEGVVSPDGWAAGTYLHGIFDNLVFTRSMLNTLRVKKGLPLLPAGQEGYGSFRQREYDRLADIVEACLDMRALQRIIDNHRP